MNKISFFLFILFLSILSSIVEPVSAFEELGEVTLESMEKPSPQPIVSGTELYWLKDDSALQGKEYITYYESIDSEKYRIKDSEDCSWTRMTGMFAPPLEYYDCYQERSATEEIIGATGNPWPLSEKTEFQYEFTGKYDDGFGEEWHSIRYCKVDQQVRVKVPAGEFDTFKLVCEDDWNRLTYWISPQIGHHVAFRHKNKSFLSRSYMLELVKVVSP